MNDATCYTVRAFRKRKYVIDNNGDRRTSSQLFYGWQSLYSGLTRYEKAFLFWNLIRKNPLKIYRPKHKTIVRYLKSLNQQ